MRTSFPGTTGITDMRPPSSALLATGCWQEHRCSSCPQGHTLQQGPRWHVRQTLGLPLLWGTPVGSSCLFPGSSPERLGAPDPPAAHRTMGDSHARRVLPRPPELLPPGLWLQSLPVKLWTPATEQLGFQLEGCGRGGSSDERNGHPHQ